MSEPFNPVAELAERPDLLDMFDDFDGWIDQEEASGNKQISEMRENVKWSIDPEERKRRLSNQSWAIDNLGLSIQDAAYNWRALRPQIASQVFGIDGEVNESQLHGAIRNRLHKEKKEADFSVELASSAIQNAFLSEHGAAGGFAQSIQKLKSHEGYDDKNRGRYYAAFKETYDNYREKTPNFHKVFEQAVQEPEEGEEKGKLKFDPKSDEFMEFSNELARLDKEDQAYALSSILKQQGESGRDFLNMVGESFRRGGIDLLENGYLREAQVNIDASIAALKKGETIYVNTQESPTSPNRYTADRPTLFNATPLDPTKLDSKAAKRILGELEKSKREIQTRKNLRQFITGQLDPLEVAGDSVVNKLKRGAIGAARSAAYTGAIMGSTFVNPYAGLWVASGLYADNSFDDIMSRNPDADAVEANKIAGLDGAWGGATEMLQAMFFTGKFSSVRDFFRKRSLPSKFAYGMAAGQAGEMAQEYVQDTGSALIEEMASIVVKDPDLKDFDLKDHLGEIYSGEYFSELFYTTLPFSIVGGMGGASMNYFSVDDLSNMMSKDTLLSEQVLPLNEIEEIDKLGTVEEKLEKFRSFFNEDGMYLTRAERSLNEKKQALQQSQANPDTPTLSQTPDGKYTVHLPDGTSFDVDSMAEAVPYLDFTPILIGGEQNKDLSKKYIDDILEKVESPEGASQLGKNIQKFSSGDLTLEEATKIEGNNTTTPEWLNTPEMRDAINQRRVGGRQGPGAAAASEWRERNFGRRFLDSPVVSDETKAMLPDKVEYRPINNVDTASDANAKIEKYGVTGVAEQILSDDARLNAPQFVMAAELLLKKIEKEIDGLVKAREEGKQVSEEDIYELSDLSSDIFLHVAAKGTEMGQGIQAFSVWGRLNPDGTLARIEKQIREKRKLRKKVETVESLTESTGTADSDKKISKAINEVEGKTKPKSSSTKPSPQKTAKKPKTPKNQAKPIIDKVAKIFSDTPNLSGKKKAETLWALWKEHAKTEMADFDARAARFKVSPKDLFQLNRLAKENRRRIASGEAAKAELERKKKIQSLIDKLVPKKKQRKNKTKIEKMLSVLEEIDELKAIDVRDVNLAFEEAFGLGELTSSQRTEIRRLAEEVRDAPEGFIRANKARQLNAYVARIEGIDAAEVLTALWYANILSGFNTQAINAFGSGMHLMLRSMTAAIADPKGAVWIIKGLLEGVEQGATKFRSVMRGEDIYRGEIKYGDRISVFEAFNNNTELGVKSQISGDLKDAANLKKLISDPKQYFKELYSMGRWVGRLLMATDGFFYRTAYEGRAYLAASRNARKQFDTPQEQARAIHESLHNTEEAVADAKAQASEDVKLLGKFDDVDVMRRTFELLDSQRDEVLKQEAQDFATLVTYTNKPQGSMGAVATGVNSIIRMGTLKTRWGDIQVFRPLVPFVNIVANVASSGLDYTPIGILRATGLPGAEQKGGYLFGESRAFSKQERIERAISGILGSALTTIIWQIAESFTDDEDPEFAIYGNGPPPGSLRDTMSAAGWTPFSIKIGDTYIKYHETPLALPFAFLGGMMDRRRYSSAFAQAELSDKIIYAATLASRAFMEAGFLSSVNQVFSMIEGRRSPKSWVANFGRGFIPAQGLLRDFAKLTDPERTDKDAGGWAGLFAKGIPFAQSYLNEPALNAFGEPIELDWAERTPILSRFISIGESDPVWDFLGSRNLKISVPKGNVSVGVTSPTSRQKYQISQIKLDRVEDVGRAWAEDFTDEERYEYIRLQGPEVRQAVEELMEKSGDLDRETLQKILDDKVRKIRRSTKLKMLGL